MTKSNERRVSKLEDSTIQEHKDIPNSVPAIYALEDDPGSELHEELVQFYNPNRKEPLQ